MEQSLSSTDVIEQWLNSPQASMQEKMMPALLQLEKSAKKATSKPSATDFIGQWRLCFIGNKQSPNSNTDTTKKSGKSLPPWLNIQLAYQTPKEMGDSASKSEISQGCIINQVQVGRLKLELSGPWMYDQKSRIMAFDFLYLKIQVFGRSLLSIPIRGGKTTEDQFWDQPLKEKAFFKYFWVTPTAIAARGKGGGIALWKKVPPKD